MNIQKLFQDLNIYDYGHIYRRVNRMTECLVKKYIYNIKLIIWWLNFSKNIMKFGFEDYYNSFVNPIYRYSASQSLFIEKKKKKKKGINMGAIHGV